MEPTYFVMQKAVSANCEVWFDGRISMHEIFQVQCRARCLANLLVMSIASVASAAKQFRWIDNDIALNRMAGAFSRM